MAVQTNAAGNCGTFQYTSADTSAVTAATAIGTLTTTRYGLKVVAPSTNTGVVYYGYSSSVTSSTGMPLPAGVETTINPYPFGGDLTQLWFLTATSGDKIYGDVL